VAGPERAERLLDILYQRDPELVPKFYSALLKNDQPRVARMLGYEGSHTIHSLCYFITTVVHCLTPISLVIDASLCA